MNSPFPGMDPYLEGYLWPDVHHRLATQIADLLIPQISPHFVARMNVSMIKDTQPPPTFLQADQQWMQYLLENNIDRPAS